MVGATFPVTFMKAMEVSRTEGGEGEVQARDRQHPRRPGLLPSAKQALE